MKITKVHSIVPYLTFSKSGKGNIKYKIKLIKRKLFKIYILGSYLDSQFHIKRELSNLCESLMNCTVQIRTFRFFLLSKASLPYNRTLVSFS